MNKRKLVTDRESKEIEDGYMETLKFVDDMVGRIGPIPAATVMTTIALSLYKTILNPDDFDELMGTIYKTRGEIKAFNREPVTLQ